MDVSVKLRVLDEEGEAFLGPGPAALLEGVEERGSLHAAARAMGMSYTKALGLVQRLERCTRRSLVERSTGGAGGGGSRLTPAARELLALFRGWEGEVRRRAEASFPSAWFGEEP